MQLRKLINYLNLEFPQYKDVTSKIPIQDYFDQLTEAKNRPQDSDNESIESFKEIRTGILELIDMALEYHKESHRDTKREHAENKKLEIDEEIIRYNQKYDHDAKDEPDEDKSQEDKSQVVISEEEVGEGFAEELPDALFRFLQAISPNTIQFNNKITFNINRLVGDWPFAPEYLSEIISALSNPLVIGKFKEDILKEQQSKLYETYEGRRQILQNIKAKLTEVKEEKSQSTSTIVGQNIQKISDELKNISKNLQSIPALIAHYRLLKDAHKGIISEYKKITLEDKSKINVLFRDARNKLSLEEIAELNKNYNNHAHWTIMGLHLINTANQLFEDELETAELKAEFRQFLNKVIEVFCEEMKKSKDPKNTFMEVVYKGVLLKKFENEFKIENAHKRLKNCKDYVNLDYDDFYHATRVRVQLPDSQSADYTRIGIPKAGNFDYVVQKHYQKLAEAENKQEPINKKMNISWFDKLSKDEKRLVRKNAQKILDGHVISNQVLGIPGIKNGREEFLLDNDNSLIFSHTQTGTLANKSKDEDFNEEATWHARQQLNNLSMQDSMQLTSEEKLNELRKKINRLPPVVMSLINENSLVTRSERGMTKQIIDATDQAALRLPTQMWRVFLFQTNAFNFGALDELIDIGENLANLLAKQLSEKEQNRANYINEALSAIQYWKNKSRFNSENANFHLAVAAQILAYAVETTLNGSCKSAKDRMGAVEEAAMHHAILYNQTGYLYPHTRSFSQAVTDIIKGNPSPEEKYNKNLQAIRGALIRSSPVAVRAGTKGATMGADGILGKAQGGLPDSWDEDLDTLIEKPASFNKGPKVDKPFYKDPIFLGFMGLAGVLLCTSGVGLIFGVPILAGITGILVSAAGVSIAAAAAPTIVSAAAGEKTSKKNPSEENPSFKKKVLAVLTSFIKKVFAVFKSPKFWIGLTIVAGGALLCATGFGAIGGIPAIAAAVPWMLGLTAVGVGAKTIELGVKNYNSPPDPKKSSWSFSSFCKRHRKKLLVTAAVIGVALVASGFGAPAGVAILGATVLATASTAIVGSAAISAAAVGGAIVVGAAYLAYDTFKKNKKNTKRIKEINIETTSLNKDVSISFNKDNESKQGRDTIFMAGALDPAKKAHPISALSPILDQETPMDQKPSKKDHAISEPGSISVPAPAPEFCKRKINHPL